MLTNLICSYSLSEDKRNTYEEELIG